jgi:hypothetical protein
MAKAYIVDSTATQVSGPVKKLVLTINAALTGTIKIIDNTTGTTANVAIITNPTVGNQFVYYDFATGVRIIASGACDITANTTDQSR